MKAVVIVLNRARPDFLGCYGNDWLPTPALDRFAADSVVFDQHFSDCPQSTAARRTWRWGTFGHLGNIHPHPGMAPLLWEQGVRTWLIGDERSPSFASGFASGWQLQRWVRREELSEIEQESLLGGTVQTAVDWLTEHGRSDNWLLWLELGTLQLPWDEAEYPLDDDKETEPEQLPWFDPPTGPVEDAAIERLQHTYGGLMQGVDDWFGQFAGFLREQGLYDETLLVLTSDAGLPLGDHGFVGSHRPWLYEELVHIPLIVKLPGKEQAGRRVRQLCQPVDLLPTLLEAFGVELKSETDEGTDSLSGRSLLPIMHGESVKLREYACAAARRQGFAEWSIRTHEWLLLLPMGRADDPPRATQLFVKPDDRWEVNNVVAQHTEVAEHLELTLRRFMAAAQAGRLEQLPGWAALRDEVLKNPQA